MAVTPAIAAEVAALNTAISSAGSLTAASQGAINALAAQASQLQTDTGAAILANAGQLDTYTSDGVAIDMASAITGMLASAQTQTSLVDLYGYAGRLATNLANG